MVQTIQAYWRPKPRPRVVRKKKPKSAEEQRAEWAAASRKQRAKKPIEEERAEIYEKVAADIDGVVMSRVVIDENACWNWTGAFMKNFSVVRPVLGSNAKVYVDVAVFIATTGKKVRKGTWLDRTCGNLKCVNPAHGAVVNHEILRAKRRIADEQLGEEERADEQQRAGADGRQQADDGGNEGGCTATGESATASPDAPEQGDGGP